MDVDLQHILDRDRRDSFRVVPDPGRPVLFEPAGRVPVPVLDISAGGVCLEASFCVSFDGESAAAARLHLPGRAPLNVVVRLVSQTADRQHLRFSGLAEADREEIYRYVLQRQIEVIRSSRQSGGQSLGRPAALPKNRQTTRKGKP
jgi:hypothetical protein